MSFPRGQGIVITARGPGKVRLLTYVNNGGIVEGTTTTNREEVTRFLISHSEKLAFFWDGAHPASCTIGEDTSKVPVGTSWNAATCIAQNSSSFTTEDVSGDVGRAVNKGNLTTCFIIPSDHSPPEHIKSAQPLATGTYSITNAKQLKVVALTDSFDGTPIVGDAANATVTDSSKVLYLLSLSLSPLITSHGQVECYQAQERKI
jgi:hypothetical protein